MVVVKYHDQKQLIEEGFIWFIILFREGSIISGDLRRGPLCQKS